MILCFLYSGHVSPQYVTEKPRKGAFYQVRPSWVHRRQHCLHGLAAPFWALRLGVFPSPSWAFEVLNLGTLLLSMQLLYHCSSQPDRQRGRTVLPTLLKRLCRQEKVNYFATGTGSPLCGPRHCLSPATSICQPVKQRSA